MARTKSVVLSTAEKKELIDSLKTQIKSHKNADKAAANAHKLVVKDFNAAAKAEEKRAAAAAKDLAKLQGELDALTQKAA